MLSSSDAHRTASVQSICLEGVDLESVRDDRMLFTGLRFELKPGQAMQIEGPNGCGKTTLLRMICGFVLPDEGEVHWGGSNIQDIRLDYQAQIAYLAHNNGIKLELTPLENLRIARELGQTRPDMNLEQALETVGMRGYETIPARALSASADISSRRCWRAISI